MVFKIKKVNVNFVMYYLFSLSKVINWSSDCYPRHELSVCISLRLCIDEILLTTGLSLNVFMYFRTGNVSLWPRLTLAFSVKTKSSCLRV